MEELYQIPMLFLSAIQVGQETERNRERVACGRQITRPTSKALKKHRDRDEIAFLKFRTVKSTGPPFNQYKQGRATWRVVFLRCCALVFLRFCANCRFFGVFVFVFGAQVLKS